MPLGVVITVAIWGNTINGSTSLRKLPHRAPGPRQSVAVPRRTETGLNLPIGQIRQQASQVSSERFPQPLEPRLPRSPRLARADPTPGRWADMVGVEGNPLEDITELQRATFVMKGGEVVIDRGPRLKT